MGAQVGQGGRTAAELRGDGPGLQAAQPHPDVGRDRPADGLHRVDKGQTIPQFLPPGGDLNPGEDDLLITGLRQGLGLVGALLQRQGAHPAPGVWDDAVGAEVDASVLDLQHGAGAALQTAGRERFKTPAVEGVIQGCDGLALLPGPLQQLHEASPVPRPGDQVHPKAAHILRMGLGVTAAYGDDSVRSRLAGPPDDMTGLFIAHRRDGAGVDNIGVRLPLKGDQGVAAPDSQLLQGLGLILIHLAAQCIKCDLHNKFTSNLHRSLWG